MDEVPWVIDQTTLFIVAAILGPLFVIAILFIIVVAWRRLTPRRPKLSSEFTASNVASYTPRIPKPLSPQATSTNAPILLPPVLPGYSVLSTQGRLSEVSPALSVYQVISLKHNQPAALKIINSSLLTQKAHRWERLEQQLTLAQTLNHPNCATLLGNNIHAPVPYFIEEWLEGGSLEAYVHTLGPMAEADMMATLIGQVCDGLAYLHARNILHGALTPSHIRFDEQHIAHIIHCGFARLVSDVKPIATGDLPAITRNDLYALGLIAFQLATGKLPFENNEAMAIQKSWPDPHSLDPSLSDKLAQAIRKALNPDPAQRFQNAHDMARAFGYDQAFHSSNLYDFD